MAMKGGNKGGQLQKGNGKGQAKPQAIANGIGKAQVLEAQFQQQANQLYEKLMDGEITTQQLSKPWNGLMNLRDQLLKAYGAATPTNKFVPPQQAAKSGNTNNDGQVNFKVELHQLYQRLTSSPATKEDVWFEHQEVEGGFVASVSCSILNMAHQGREVATSKKGAEQAACKEAIMKEHHAEYARIMGLNQGQANGKKRKAPAGGPLQAVQQAAAPDADNVKSRLSQAAQLLKGGACVKGDVTYECVEADGEGGFVATVTISCYDPSVGYQGTPAPSKKMAENYAAEAAMAALAETLAPLEQEQQARKKQKNQEQLKLLKERMAEKKAAAAVEQTQA